MKGEKFAKTANQSLDRIVPGKERFSIDRHYEKSKLVERTAIRESGCASEAQRSEYSRLAKNGATAEFYAVCKLL